MELAVAAPDATGESSCAYEEGASDVIVPCPQCKIRFELKDPSISGSGKLIRCPACNSAFVVKSADEEEVASAARAGIRAPAVKAVEEIVIPGAKKEERPASGGPAKAASPTPPADAVFPSLAEETVQAGAESEVYAHVLVAGDNEVDQLVVVVALESMGCRVDAVEDGQQAIDLLEGSTSYDAVFIDCEMPTMDALDVTRVIRAREAEAAQAAGGAPVRRLPIVALTAHDRELDRQQCLAAGMDDYLSKPFTKADLQGAIERAKQGAFAEVSAPARSQRPDPPAPAAKPKKRSKSSRAGAAAPKKRSKSTGAGAAAPQSRARAGNPPGRAAREERAARKTPRRPDGPPPPIQMPREAAAAPPLPRIASATPTGQGAPQQNLASTRGADLDGRSRAEPRWRQLIRDSCAVMFQAIRGMKSQAIRGAKSQAIRGAVSRVLRVRWRKLIRVSRAVMPWVIGGGAFLLLLALVDLLWLRPPGPQLAAPSPAAAEVAPEPTAKPATAVQLRKKTTPRTSVRRAAKSPTRARTTRTPKTKSATSASSSGRRKAVPAETKPRKRLGSRTFKKEPSTRSRSRQKETQDRWIIEY